MRKLKSLYVYVCEDCEYEYSEDYEIKYCAKCGNQVYKIFDYDNKKLRKLSLAINEMFKGEEV